MTAIGQVKGALMKALTDAGIDAREAFGEKEFRALCAPLAALGVHEAKITRAGFLDYLGESYDEVRGTIERYAKAMDLTLSLDLFASDEASCTALGEACASALSLCRGVRVESITLGACEWDRRVGAMHRGGSISCKATFIAEAAEDETLVQDFILKGTVDQ